MKIGFDAKRLFFNNRGLGNYSRSTVSLLARYLPQHRYLLFSPRPGNPYGFDAGPNTETVVPSGVRSLSPALWRSYLLGSELRGRGIELYHGLCHEVPLDIRRSGARSVVTMHDLIFVRHPELYKPFDRWCFCRKYRRSCDLADKVVAISEQTREDLVDLWHIDPGKIEVVYQGCSPRFAEPVAQQTLERVRRRYALPEHYVLSVGAIEERKNLGLVLRAMVARGLDFHLVACGARTPYSDALMRYAVQHGIDSRVRFLHGVPFADLPALYRMADAMVYPSLFEGFGIPILEALNAGVPTITSRGGVFAETGGDACLYVDPHSEEEMAEALQRVLGDGELRRSMVEKGRAHAALFTEERIAHNLEALYRSLF